MKKDVSEGFKNGYFLTEDVSSVLKVINKNMKLDGSVEKRRGNMMTEEDIERLFERDPYDKKKSEQKYKDIAQQKRK